MKKLLVFLLVILGIAGKTYSQKLLPIASDYSQAIKIPLKVGGSYGPTVAPKGFGEVQEIKSSKNSSFSFEKEHNTTWYYFDVVQDGDLSIEITPTQSSDDYDFMLFKYTDSSFCRMLANNQIKPVRSNIARTGKGGSGKTGLSLESKSLFVQLGPGKSFSKSIEVKKGERYYLVLDNVYPDGLGHMIVLGYQKEVEISGIVLSDDNKPLKADVILSDNKGNEVEKVESDSVTGKYSLFTMLWKGMMYNLSFVNDSSFVGSQKIYTDSLVKTGYKLVDIRTVLPKLKGGKKYKLSEINFYPNSNKLLPESYPSVRALEKLMQKNKKIVIRIEGHVNDPSHSTSESELNFLSKSRAAAIYEILVSGGINPERISVAGYGRLFMIYPYAMTDEEAKANRRVEIKFVSFN